MELILTVLILLCCAANLACSVRMYRRLHRHDEADRIDRAVEKAAAEEEAKKKDLIDEGIDNILLYSVNGKTGFERDSWQGG